jgi:hypothetical protein
LTAWLDGRSRHIPVVDFEKGQRKETSAEPHFLQAALFRRKGVVLVGIAQEKANVFRPPRKGRRDCGGGSAPGAPGPSSTTSSDPACVWHLACRRPPQRALGIR